MTQESIVSREKLEMLAGEVQALSAVRRVARGSSQELKNITYRSRLDVGRWLVD
jgi:hypothetical protein